MPDNARTAYLFGLPPISGLPDLARQVHLSRALLYRLSTRSDHYYRVFDVPKRSGGKRTIYSPSKELKAVQGWVLRRILDPLAHLATERVATAFRS